MGDLGRPKTWNDDDLRRAVTVSRSWAGVCRALDLTKSTKAYRRVQRRAAELGLDTDHFDPDDRTAVAGPVVVEGTREERAAAVLEERRRQARSRAPGVRLWDDERLASAVVSATSWAGVHRELGIEIGGSTYRMLQRRAEHLGLDTSHFTGKRWARGTRNPSRRTRRPLHELLVEDSPTQDTHRLKLRLFQEGVKARTCEGCGGSEWRGQPLPLQLDHINGVRSDNRLENLRILCPNCHAQTDTWCGRNRSSNRK